MRIVIDLQGAQTESRFRGIGRYTLSLARSIIRYRGDHEIIIALNGLFPDTIEPIRVAFDDLLPQENIRVWYAPGPVCECTSDNTWRRESAELIREAFLASLRPDVVHIPSLFEGYEDDAVTSIRRFDKTTPTCVTIHDLIPLLNQDHYLKPNQAYKEYYFRKINHLRNATLLLAISNSSRQEGIDFVGIPEDMIINTSEAADERFHPVTVTENQSLVLGERFGLSRPFLLYTGGADERKNLPRLIRAYGRLPPVLRQAHQLLFAGKMGSEVMRLQAEAKSAGLGADELRFTGYITDNELVLLYNSCKLYVFPSWHEGFGLPALEAMACGAPVIGANTSSLPEVIGREDALFDPFAEEAITEKIAEALGSKAFREDLSRHGLRQSKLFSWDKSGQRAIRAFEQAGKHRRSVEHVSIPPLRKLKLAYVSPLPPERTGIADYSAELLPALAHYYDIEVIVAQSRVSDQWITKNCLVHSFEWFKQHANSYQRVLYHLGNSPFHHYMFDLLEQIPGVVCLHDFFMSGYSRYMEQTVQTEFEWSRDLYNAHGYRAVRERFHCSDDEVVMYEYPCNLDVLGFASGIVVHSSYSKQLAAKWYGSSWGDDWITIPHMREPCEIDNQQKSRDLLKLNNGAFLVCSFGLLAPTKLNHRLLKAWLSSSLAKDSRCHLIFVGENHGGDYGNNLIDVINKSGVKSRIHITGWVDTDQFRQYLAAADLAVQLRALSRGETSGTVLDCMNHATATIINANGSLADLPRDAVWMLDDEFEDADLVMALETLWRDEIKRQALGQRGREIIVERHAPEVCARQYAVAIEGFYLAAETNRRHLAQAIADQSDLSDSESIWRDLALCIAQNQPDLRPARYLFVDVTATCRTDLKTGIERVTRALLLELIDAPPPGYRVEPVYLTDQGGQWHYRYARHYALKLLDCPNEWLEDEPIEVQAGDLLFAPDMAGHRLVGAEKAGLYRHLRNIGVSLYFLVHDLLPVTMPEVFPPGAKDGFEAWLGAACRAADVVICVTKTVADDLDRWLEIHPLGEMRALRVDWSHHGADLGASAPTKGISADDQAILATLSQHITFLMVGTVEPRKGYLQAIAAFDQLWREGMDINLVVVGKEGWKDLPEGMRRSIPEIVKTLRNHPELGKRLFWLEGISDECLGKIYAASDCLIVASNGEGFGLPLIEAAQHKLPIIARDLPVFHEVANEYAYYFSGLDIASLAITIKKWIVLYGQGQHPNSDSIPWLTWKESAENLKNIFAASRKVL